MIKLLEDGSRWCTKCNCNAYECRCGWKKEKSKAVCHVCSRNSRQVEVCSETGEPDLWNMARGWSKSRPIEGEKISKTPIYTCPACNRKSLKDGKLIVTLV